MTQEITIKLTLGLKMIIFIVFMVIENIPDLKIRLLSGIWLSSGDLLSIEFSLFFRLFLRFFLCLRYFMLYLSYFEPETLSMAFQRSIFVDPLYLDWMAMEIVSANQL